MTTSISKYNKDTQNINNSSLKTNPFDKYSNIFGYIPVIGVFVGIRRIYKTLSSEKISELQILRGSLEIVACGPILAIFDGIIYTVKKICKWMKKNKTDQKTISIPSKLKNTSKEPSTTTMLKKSTSNTSIKTQTKVEKKEAEENAKKSFSSETLPDATKSLDTPPEEAKLVEENLNEETPSLETIADQEIPSIPVQEVDVPRETTLIENIENAWDSIRVNFYNFISSKKAPVTILTNTPTK